MSIFWRGLLVLFLLGMWTESATAADFFNDTVTHYQQLAQGWYQTFLTAGQYLFFALATISLVMTIGRLAASGDFSLGTFVREFVFFGITVGFFLWLMLNSTEILNAIIDGLQTLGARASGQYFKMSPSIIVGAGVDICMTAFEQFDQQDWSTWIVCSSISFVVFILFLVLACQLTVMLCVIAVFVGVAPFFIGFAGGPWTRDISIGYLRKVLALAIQVMALSIVLGIGMTEMYQMRVEVRQAKNLSTNPSGGNTNKVNTQLSPVNRAISYLIRTLLLFVLSFVLPSMLAGVVGGGGGMHMRPPGMLAMGVGGMGVGLVGGAAQRIASAGGAVSGGASALAAAYRQTQQHQATGQGVYSAKADDFQTTAGFFARTSTAARDMAANLVSAYEGRGYEQRQRATGGTMADRINDRTRAERAAYDAEQEVEAAKAEAQVAVSGSAGRGGGGP